MTPLRRLAVAFALVLALPVVAILALPMLVVIAVEDAICSWRWSRTDPREVVRKIRKRRNYDIQFSRN